MSSSVAVSSSPKIKHCTSMFLMVDDDMVVYYCSCSLPEHDASTSHYCDSIKLKYTMSNKVYSIPTDYMWNSQSDTLTLSSAPFIPHDAKTHELHKVIRADKYDAAKMTYTAKLKLCKFHAENYDNSGQVYEIDEVVKFQWR